MNTDSKTNNDNNSDFIKLGGVALFSVGLPFYVIGMSKYRNIQAAMQRIRHVSKFSLGSSEPRIGIRLSLD